jgi:serine/threonine protein kinase
MSAMFRIVEDENGPPVPSSSSPKLRAFLARCFQKDPKNRPTATELFDDPWLLQHFVPHSVSSFFPWGYSATVSLTVTCRTPARTCVRKTRSLSLEGSRATTNDLDHASIFPDPLHQSALSLETPISPSIYFLPSKLPLPHQPAIQPLRSFPSTLLSQTTIDW